MSQRNLVIKWNLVMMTFLHAMAINAANTQSYPQINIPSFPYASPIYPTQQMESPDRYISQNTFKDNENNNFHFLNSYPYQPYQPYQPLIVADRRKNIAFVEPEAPTVTGTSHIRPQLISQDRRLPFWMGKPIVADYASKQYFASSGNTDSKFDPSIRSDEYLYSPETRYSENIYYNSNRAGMPSFAQSSAVIPLQPTGYRSATAVVDYATHFKQYVRKYPKRLRPTFDGNGLI